MYESKKAVLVCALSLMLLLLPAAAMQTDELLKQLGTRINALPSLYVLPPDAEHEIREINAQLSAVPPVQMIEIVEKLPSQGSKVQGFVVNNLVVNKRKETIPHLKKWYAGAADALTRAFLGSAIVAIDYDGNAEFILHALNDSNDWVRYTILNSILGRPLRGAELDTSLRLLRHDPSHLVRERAIFAIAESGAPDAQRWLEQALSEEKDDGVRKQITSALKEIKRAH